MGERHFPERRLRRIVLKVMSTPFTLPLLGGSLLAAVAVGIHLGESSIGLIKPIYFQGPAPHPRERGAAIDETLAPAPARTTYASLYGWSEGNAALADECDGCDAPPPHRPRVYSAVVPYFGERGASEPSSPEKRSADVAETPPSDLFRDRERRERDIDRYAHYPITEAEAATGGADKRAEPAYGPRAEYETRRASYQERDVWLEPERRERWER